MSNGITISGLDECLRYFNNAPEELVKATRKAMRDASTTTTRMIKRRIPKRWNRLVRYKVSNKGSLLSTIGMFNGHQAQGNQPKNGKIDDWFKAYWLNYGTLDKRDPEHQFDRPVKHRATQAAKNRRNTAGISPRKFFEASIGGWQTTFVEAFKESLKKQEYDIDR